MTISLREQHLEQVMLTLMARLDAETDNHEGNPRI